MERRYQVFVSSTFLDLREERQAIVAALLEMDAFPAGMELFPASDEDAWTLIQGVIDSSDYYLLVIGAKYGSIDPETDLSYTEKEFDYAVLKKKPVMAFLHEDPDSLPVRDAEKDEALRLKLEAFREKVKVTKHVKFWKNGPDDLAGKVARSFASMKSNQPAVGWIRGDAQTSSESLAELNDLRKRLEQAESSLDAARTAPPPGTEDLQQGSDWAEFSANARTKIHTDRYDHRGKAVTKTIPIAETWDELFSTLGPQMLDEADQDTLATQLRQALTERYRAEFIAAVKKSVKQSVDRTTETSVALSPNDFGTLIVQLRALGLIQRSERKRSVNDQGTYWTLTPFGDAHLTQLRARRRPT